MVYTGNELACTAHLNMFANRFHMGKFEVTDRTRKSTPESIRRQDIIKKLNKLKKESDVLRFGETVWIDSYDGECIISFKRRLENDEIVFIGNAKDKSCEILLDFVPENILLGNFTVSGSTLTLKPYQYIVFENRM